MARCGCLGVIWGINGGATVGGAPLSQFGTETQKQKYLAPLLRGEQRHCLMITEPDGTYLSSTVLCCSGIVPLLRMLIRYGFNTAGSDVGSLTTTAEMSADGKSYTINGQKKWVTQGQWATHALVGCRTSPTGSKGLSVFIVDLSAEGVTRKKMENSGVHSSGKPVRNTQILC